MRKASNEPLVSDSARWLGMPQPEQVPPEWAGLEEQIRELSPAAHFELTKHALYLREMGITVTRESAERMIYGARRMTAWREERDARDYERMTTATVYYVRIGSLIKIGQAFDVRKRLQAYPPDALLLATETGERDTLEAERHRQFRDTRVGAYRREWFYPSAELIEHINSLRAEPLTAAELAS